MKWCQLGGPSNKTKNRSGSGFSGLSNSFNISG